MLKNKEEIERLKKLRKWKNSIEIWRIDIAIEIVKWSKFQEIKDKINCWNDRIILVKRRYKEDANNFFKTNYKWAKETITRETTDKIILYIKEKQGENKWVDIYEILDFLWFERNDKNYKKVWYITRRKLKLNYQKPYIKDKKSPDNSEEILKKKYRWEFKMK